MPQIPPTINGVTVELHDTAVNDVDKRFESYAHRR